MKEPRHRRVDAHGYAPEETRVNEHAEDAQQPKERTRIPQPRVKVGKREPQRAQQCSCRNLIIVQHRGEATSGIRQKTGLLAELTEKARKAPAYMFRANVRLHHASKVVDS